MAVGDFTIACFRMHGRAARKTLVRNPQEPDTTQHTSGQILVSRRVTVRTTLV